MKDFSSIQTQNKIVSPFYENNTVFQKLFPVRCPEKTGLSLEKKRLSLGGDKMIVLTMFRFHLGEGKLSGSKCCPN
jgi:hypothetical protein